MNELIEKVNKIKMDIKIKEENLEVKSKSLDDILLNFQIYHHQIHQLEKMKLLIR